MPQALSQTLSQWRGENFDLDIAQGLLCKALPDSLNETLFSKAKEKSDIKKSNLLNHRRRVSFEGFLAESDESSL